MLPDRPSAHISLMVKEQIPVFVLNSGAHIEATRRRLTHSEGYIMNSRFPLEERDPCWLPALHAHSRLQHLDDAVLAPVVLPSSRTNHTGTACFLGRSSRPPLLSRFPNRYSCASRRVASASSLHNRITGREKLAYCGPGSKT